MENVVKYHFAPSELYTWFAIGIACYTVTASKFMSSESSNLTGALVDLFFYFSWVPLALHYLIIISGLPPVIFIDLSDMLSNPKEFHEASKYAAYHVHIVTLFLLPFWMLLPQKVRYDEQDESSEEVTVTDNS